MAIGGTEISNIQQTKKKESFKIIKRDDIVVNNQMLKELCSFDVNKDYNGISVEAGFLLTLKGKVPIFCIYDEKGDKVHRLYELQDLYNMCFNHIESIITGDENDCIYIQGRSELSAGNKMNICTFIVKLSAIDMTISNVVMLDENLEPVDEIININEIDNIMY